MIINKPKTIKGKSLHPKGKVKMRIVEIVFDSGLRDLSKLSPEDLLQATGRTKRKIKRKKN